MTGSSSQRKGKRAEREVVRLLRDAGIPSRRVPLSGSVEGSPGDVVIGLGDRELVGEVKRRRVGTYFFVARTGVGGSWRCR